jgi:hypothetical protein
MDCHGGRSTMTVGGESGGEMVGHDGMVENQHGRVTDHGINQNHWWYCMSGRVALI